MIHLWNHGIKNLEDKLRIEDCKSKIFGIEMNTEGKQNNNKYSIEMIFGSLNLNVEFVNVRNY